MKTINLAIKDIKPYPNNPRNNEEAVKKVRKSIEKYGYIQPITVDKNNVIITGHTRYYAMMDLKRKNVGVLVLDLPEDKAAEYRLVDNKVHEYAQWDFQKLKTELRDASEDMRVFFDDWDYDKFISIEMGKAITDVNDSDIFNTEERIKSSKSKKNIYTDVICPNCGKVLQLKL